MRPSGHCIYDPDPVIGGYMIDLQGRAAGRGEGHYNCTARTRWLL